MMTATLGAAAILVAGCSSDPEPVAVTQSSIPLPTSTENPAPTSPRGAMIKTVGEPAGIKGGENGQRAFEFTLTEVDTAVTCTEDWSTTNEPKNGRWVLMNFEIETFTSAPTSPLLGKYDFYSVTEDGYISGVGESTGDNCLPDVAWDGVWTPKPNSKYEVSFLMDVPLDATAVGYDWSPGTVPVASWEWELPV